MVYSRNPGIFIPAMPAGTEMRLRMIGMHRPSSTARCPFFLKPGNGLPGILCPKPQKLHRPASRAGSASPFRRGFRPAQHQRATVSPPDATAQPRRVQPSTRCQKTAKGPFVFMFSSEKLYPVYTFWSQFSRILILSTTKEVKTTSIVSL